MKDSIIGKVNLDALTGVKNKQAYIDIEAQIDSLIEQGEPQEFAIVVMDINGLKMVNDTKGHQAGEMARYRNERCVGDVFSKADANMYQNKGLLKL